MTVLTGGIVVTTSAPLSGPCQSSLSPLEDVGWIRKSDNIQEPHPACSPIQFVLF